MEAGTTRVLVIQGPIARVGIPALCARARALLEDSDGALLICDLGTLGDPDAVAVDALARLQLTARRLGNEIRLRHASDELQELIALAGLDDVVPLCSESVLQMARKSECGEQLRGIEEESDPRDRSV